MSVSPFEPGTARVEGRQEAQEDERRNHDVRTPPAQQVHDRGSAEDEEVG
jgi:hypothetical protein